jgi:hypothetical protein
MRVYQIFSISINVIKLEPHHINCVTLKSLHGVVDEDTELSLKATNLITTVNW